MFGNTRQRHVPFKALLTALVLLSLALAPHKEASASFASLTIYTPQPITPTYISNFVDPQAGCDWAGVGGQVFNQRGLPENGLVVRISGLLEGSNRVEYALSGSSQQFGAGGYEIALADHALNSDGLQLQLFDLAGEAKSPVVIVRLSSNCQQNLTVVNFRQVTFTRFLYLPVLHR